jgi:hypothetical protein
VVGIEKEEGDGEQAVASQTRGIFTVGESVLANFVFSKRKEHDGLEQWNVTCLSMPFRSFIPLIYPMIVINTLSTRNNLTDLPPSLTPASLFFSNTITVYCPLLYFFSVLYINEL